MLTQILIVAAVVVALCAIGRYYSHAETGLALAVVGAALFFGMHILIQNAGGLTSLTVNTINLALLLVGMLFALGVYITGLKYLPPELKRPKTKAERTPLSREEWKSVGALVLLVLPSTLWWACYEQQGNIIALFADAATDRRLIPGVINWQIPVTWFQAFNPFIIFAFTPFIIALWTRQAATLRE